MPFTFRLRPGFPKAHAGALAARRTFDDERLVDIGRRSRDAGYYDADDFLIICESATNTKLCSANPSERIKRHTAAAIAATSERHRICSLMRLSGISWRMASVVLHFTFEDQYPTLSRRTLWSWGYDTKPEVLNFSFWWGYVEASRNAAQECSLTMRNLDRALRQFATEQKEGSPPLAKARSTSA